MVLWIVAGPVGASRHMEGLLEAERAGAELGAGIGMMALVALWVIGHFILGLFTLLTRPRN